MTCYRHTLTLFRSSPNTDGFYTFYVPQGSVVTQLRCGGMFSNHFTTNFSQNAAVKRFWKSVNIWQRYGQKFVAYFFGATLYVQRACSTWSWPLQGLLQSEMNSLWRLETPFKVTRWKLTFKCVGGFCKADRQAYNKSVAECLTGSQGHDLVTNRDHSVSLLSPVSI